MTATVDNDPFPKWQIIALSFCLVSHSVALTSLLPYVGFMVQDLGLADNIDDAGWYAGYVTGSFMVGRTISSYFWGKISDKYGRLPVIYFSLSAVAVFSLLFGFSVNIWMAIAIRFSLGLCNGLVGAAKTMVSEVCSAQHESQGMGMVSGCWSLGFIIGPAVGGILARPVDQYNLSSSWWVTLLTKFPYLLPNLFPVMLVIIAVIISRRNLKETLTASINDHQQEEEEEDGIELTTIHHKQGLRYTSLSSSSSSSSNSLLIIFGLTSSLDIMFDTVLPIWLISSYGFGASSQSIGLLLVATGAVLVFYEIIIFPRLNDYYGPDALVKYSWFIAAPFILFISIHANWYSVLMLFIVQSIPVSSSFTALSVLINHSVPRRERGAINGMSQMVGSIARAIGPVVGAIIFAWSIQEGQSVVDYHFSFYVMAGYSCIIGIFCCFILK